MEKIDIQISVAYNEEVILQATAENFEIAEQKLEQLKREFEKRQAEAEDRAEQLREELEGEDNDKMTGL